MRKLLDLLGKTFAHVLAKYVLMQSVVLRKLYELLRICSPH